METLGQTRDRGLAWHCWGGGLRAGPAALRTTPAGRRTRGEPGIRAGLTTRGTTPGQPRTDGARGPPASRTSTARRGAAR
eukprot:7811362-Alexandrium_andersonii.AAC.1